MTTPQEPSAPGHFGQHRSIPARAG